MGFDCFVINDPRPPPYEWKPLETYRSPPTRALTTEINRVSRCRLGIRVG